MNKQLAQMEKHNKPLLVKAKALRICCDDLAINGQHKSEEWQDTFKEYIGVISKLQYPAPECIAP